MKSVCITIRDMLQKHAIPVLTGIVMALLVVSPHIRAVTSMGVENFKGVYPLFSDDEVTYLARIKEIQEGHFSLGNPYIKEHMNDPFIMPPIAEGFFALLSHITGASVPRIMSVSDGVFGFVCFMLIYTLFQVLTKSMWMSLVYALLFFFFSLATFGRPISPQFNALFLFTGLISIAKVYFNTALWGRRWNIIIGLVTGVTCFISPYYFTALLAFYMLVFLLRAIMERNHDVLLKNVPWFFFGFLPLALVYAFFQVKAGYDPSYEETVLRYGLMYTYIPGSFTNVFFGGLAFLVLALCFRTFSNRKFAFAFGSVVTLFALNWQNILTGKSLQFSSHYLFVSILLILISFALIHTALVSREMVNLGRMRRFLIIGGMAFLLVVIGYNQKGEFINLGKTIFTREELLEEQKKMEIFDWFNEYTEPDSVVYTLGGGYDFLLPVYTHNKVFYNFYAALYPAPDRETEERWLIQHYFDGDVSSTTIRDSQRDFWGNRYIDSYQSTENRKKILAMVTSTPYVPVPMIRDEQIVYMYARWLDIRSKPFEESLARYEIDYILLSKEYPFYEETKTRLDKMNTVSLVSTLNEGLVYKLR